MPRNLRNKSWLSHWEQYMSNTEAPTEYITWSGISAISAALKKNIWITRPKYNIYPNMYIVLVGPPGVGKGTVINPVLDLFSDPVQPFVNTMSDRITAEEVLKKLSDGFGSGMKTTSGKVSLVQDRTVLITATELPIYLNSSIWTTELMCDLWDNKPSGTSYSTKTKGSYEAKDTCVSLLGGCVPDYIRKLNKDAMSAITGGFTSRCIFVYAGDRGKYDAWPTIDPGEAKYKADLINDLRHISSLTGEVTFDSVATGMWTHHYNSFAKQEPFESEVLAGFKARTMAHVFKTAMAICVSTGDKLVINRDILYNAIGLVNGIKEKVDIVFRCVGESPIAMAQDRVLTFIDLQGLTTRKQILRYLGRHITDEDLSRVLRVLITSGLIIESGDQYQSTKVKGFKKNP